MKAWIIISVFSLFLYSLAQLLNSVIGTGYHLGFGAIVELFVFLSNGHSNWSTIFILGHVFPELGVIARFAGLTIALLLAYFVLVRKKPWSNVRGKIASVVFLEGLFFLSLLSTVPMLLNLGFLIFAFSYLVQVLLTAPFLIILSLRIRRSNAVSQDLLKFIGLVFLGYLAAIWVNNIFRWVYMATMMGAQFLFVGGTSLGFLNAAVILSAALGFGAAGFLSLLKRKNNPLTLKLFGLSLALTGIYFLIYLFYSALAGALGSVMLVEIWAVPLLGLGMSILLRGKKSKKHEELVIP